MQLHGRESGQIVVGLSADELRLVLACVNEVLNGPHAVDDEEWSDLIGQPQQRAVELAEGIATVLAAVGQ